MCSANADTTVGAGWRGGGSVCQRPSLLPCKSINKPGGPGIGTLGSWRAETRALWSRLMREGGLEGTHPKMNDCLDSRWLKQNMWETSFPISLQTTLSPGFPLPVTLSSVTTVSLDSLHRPRPFTFYQASYPPNPPLSARSCFSSH